MLPIQGSVLAGPAFRAFKRAVATCGAIAMVAAVPAFAADPPPTPVSTPVTSMTQEVSPTPAASPEILQQLWSGTAPDATSSSTTVASATDPLTGNLWVAVPFESRYWIFAPDGTYLESWGTSGSDPGQLDLTDHQPNPDGWGPIAFAPDGSFVIGDTGNNRIQVFDKDRNFVRQWGSFGTDDGQFVQLISVATDGKVVVAGDGLRYDIQTFDMEGTHLQTFGGDIGAWSVAFDSQGRVLATNSENPYDAPMSLTTYNLDGTVASSVDLTFTGGWPVWEASDAAGHVFVTVLFPGPHWDWQTWELAPDGTVLRQIAQGGDAISLSPTGDALYVGRGVQLDGHGSRALRAYAITPLP